MKRSRLPLAAWIGVPLAVAACASPGGGHDRSADAVDQDLSVCAGAATVSGVDTSSWQGPVDWAAVKASGRSFAIARVSDGTDYPDAQFATDWPGIAAAGLVRGVYQFFRPEEDPIAQADLLIAKLAAYGALGPGDLPAIVDVEVVDGVSTAVFRKNLQAWLDHVQAATGKRPMIYTAAFMASTIGTGFSGYPLWVANYGVTCPQLPSGWSSWQIWQSGDSGTVPGISGGVDVDVFDGTLAQLVAFASGAGSGGGGADAGGGGGPLCLSAASGAYCGNDSMSGASAGTLYQCAGANRAPTSSQACPNGCHVAPAGTADTCNAGGETGGDAGAGDASSGGAASYRLPWRPSSSMYLTQDCNDSCCNDHVGTDAYAWDFAYGGTGFDVLAARGGVVTHVKMNSTKGCASVACENEANFIVIDHGDGTQSTYLHLQGFTLDPAVTCGATVAQGQRLATSGATGWASGTHLHYQVDAVHPGAPTCECGADGLGCAADYVPWANFWSNATYPALPISFVEWPEASSCADRRIALPASQN